MVEMPRLSAAKILATAIIVFCAFVYLLSRAPTVDNGTYTASKSNNPKNDTRVRKKELPKTCTDYTTLRKRAKCWIGTDILDLAGDFYKTLNSKANDRKEIILASVDESFVDMAVNMYLTSFKKFNITNFLFVCSDTKAKILLKAHGIDCFLYEQETDNNQASEYGSKSFILKMRVKMKMVTAALLLNFTTVLSDVDIVFFKNPLPDMQYDYDIALMSDVVMDNCGFYIAKPTKGGIELHTRTLEQCMTRVIADQDAIFAAIKTMTNAGTLKKTNLPRNKFPSGIDYFEGTKRMFKEDSPCDTNKCSINVMHNNWIVGKPAKIYRFKETGLWLYDNDGYYSDPEAKYLSYENPKDFGGKSFSVEKESLKTALTLGKILNRTVILPRFHCYGCNRPPCKIANDHCALNAHFYLKTFDQHFSKYYRENSFLKHPAVPNIIKESISNEIIIMTKKYQPNIANINETKIHRATYFNKGVVNKRDILNWFSQNPMSNFSVLRFKSLYFKITEEDKGWTLKLNAGLKKSTYRQYQITGRR